MVSNIIIIYLICIMIEITIFKHPIYILNTIIALGASWIFVYLDEWFIFFCVIRILTLIVSTTIKIVIVK